MLTRTHGRFPTSNQGINRAVIGCIKILFPQGIIVHLGQQVFGVTDYKLAYAKASPEFTWQINYQLFGIVTGYDEINQWIELSSPQIYTDKRCNSDTWDSPLLKAGAAEGLATDNPENHE